MHRNKEFEKILQAAEDPKNIGRGSWALPENTTFLQKTKYEICKQILIYKQDNNLSTEELTKKINEKTDKKNNLTSTKTKDILFYHIDYFSLEQLMTYAEKLFSPAEIRLIIESKKDKINDRRTV
ncbi:MAG: hypothetical protein I3273_01000 [Candidatus Moeniiplasma glomeromycotorum]|nr:hypothetical protein [Candidatus Moeniiplasma glomeromycotorum]MCE8167301.1 hypothetical protein [Candidatus Moeniiplasma glomeromycotorum]MCE8168686.1 hypothetical protein [Candidatus Moeniiplasma glomeromycotorum]